MATMIADIKNEIINKIVDLIIKKFSKNQATLIAEFARQYYETVAVDDLEACAIEDLYGSVVSLWQFIYERKETETKIRVFNPHIESYGWQSTHTIVEISKKDMPFLVDTTCMEINRHGLSTHLIIHMGGMNFVRDEKQQIKEVLPRLAQTDNNAPKYEAIIHIEIDRQTDPKQLKDLEDNLSRVLGDVDAAVEDWNSMQQRLKECIDELEAAQLALDPAEISESKEFLQWLTDNHFTFLGCRDYKLTEEGNEKILKLIRGSGLGVLHDDSHSRSSRTIADMPIDVRKQILSQQILIIAKTNTISTVHRPSYTDYIGVKRFNKQGEVIGERRFVGLYTSSAYNTSPRYIPLLRSKVNQVMAMSGLLPNGHAGKALLHILETLPRDDLFQGNKEELYELGMGIYHLQERRRIRLFTRKDIYGRYISCFIFVPRDRFNSQLRHAMQTILVDAFNGTEVNFTTRFGESTLAQVHFVIRIDPKSPAKYDLKQVEKELVEVARTWQDDLQAALIEKFGEERGNTSFRQYADAFPASYKEFYPARTAVCDIEHIEKLSEEMPLGMSFYRLPDEDASILHFKLFKRDKTVTLSDALPMFENMGLRVIGEYPHELIFKDKTCIWINDFMLKQERGIVIDIETIKEVVQDAFTSVWLGKAENDGFNRLVLSAHLTWREVSTLRAYAKYFRQAGFTFSQTYIEQALANNAAIAGSLVKLFNLYFNVANNAQRKEQCEQLEATIEKALDSVANLDEDRILRRYLEIIRATMRTNYFQKDQHGTPKQYISFKFNPELISDLPLPRPMFEIFVYSPRFEAVHLRGAKVARGGIRWSDRREDFRTEILGLMKAQQVKNSVIVPLGAKGGFVVKNLPGADATREMIMAEVIDCYKNFMRGLLDITDNLINNQLSPPTDVIRYDEDDPYLVVAADKGTATFSNIANEISREYSFWLDDAFASGGSAGYDHKGMGITARGAWESVRRHFHGLGINPDEHNFTVVGIGDMGGDVFGNGMLLSQHIKLVGAFNHQHIFIDPNPEPLASFNERKRLFNLPRSSWEDYSAQLISQGGGIFKRSAKSIKVTPEMKEIFDITKDAITPNELISTMLKARVDLLWNGGIGTYVKSSEESDGNVGDRTNDAVRVNGGDLRCSVAAEGGNLGFTQLGRVEYSLNNGLCFTDFIDNSAGVDCSDHEVNIKILLNQVIQSGDMTEKQRNVLLAKMTDEVAALVLQDNFRQTQALSRAAFQADSRIDLHERFIQHLEQEGKLNRALEFLPDAKGFFDRKSIGKGLTRPELAVLFAYSKNTFKQEILATDAPDDPDLLNMLQFAFPKPLTEGFRKYMEQHSLRREIIATVLSNSIVNDMGLTFAMRLLDETGADVGELIRAYMIVYHIFHVGSLTDDLNALDAKLTIEDQVKLVGDLNRLIRRCVRWFLRNRRGNLNISRNVEYFSPCINELRKLLPELLPKDNIEAKRITGSSQNLTDMIAGLQFLFPALDIADGALQQKVSIKEFAKIYYALGEQLDLDWLRLTIVDLFVNDRWQALARANYRDEVDLLQRDLTVGVLKLNRAKKMVLNDISEWIDSSAATIARWHKIVANIRSSTAIDYTMIYIATRGLFDVVLATLAMVE